MGYYPAMLIGTAIVFVSVMICFEIARRAVLFRPLFGIKGGDEEVNKLFPYNRADSTMRTVYSLFFNALALGMIVMLLLWLIGAGVIAELGGAR